MPRNVCFAITGLVRGGVCQGYVRCVSVARIHFPAPNQRRNATKLNTLTSSNFIGNGRSDLPSFFMDRCPKNEATAKNFVWNKSSFHSQEN